MVETKRIEYWLEIYDAGGTPSGADPLVMYKSDSPFLIIARGDLIRRNELGPSATPGLLRVVNIEHLLWEVSTHVGHKILIFTEEVENGDSDDILLGKQT